jgi:hypothetical protein
MSYCAILSTDCAPYLAFSPSLTCVSTPRRCQSHCHVRRSTAKSLFANAVVCEYSVSSTVGKCLCQSIPHHPGPRPRCTRQRQARVQHRRWSCVCHEGTNYRLCLWLAANKYILYGVHLIRVQLKMYPCCVVLFCVMVCIISCICMHPCMHIYSLYIPQLL